jgi:pyruvate,water dikinase
MAQAIAPQPIYYRSTDLSAPDWHRLALGSKDSVEQNPAIGLRGTLRYLEEDEWFEQELMMLKALLREGIQNLRLILPFVRSPQEVIFCRQKIQAIGLDPETELPIWMMAEVPSVLFELAQYQLLGLQGIMIGTSDLLQLLLGIDRNHPAFQTVLAQNESGVITALRQLVRQASSLNLSSILCSSMAHYHTQAMLAPLIQAGLSGVTVEMSAVHAVRAAIAQAEQELGLGHNSGIPIP